MERPEVPLEQSQEEILHHARHAAEKWISVLTKRKSFWFGSLGFGAAGVLLLLAGLITG
jgi:hypothetical protein